MKLLIVFLLAGCASVPPPRPAADVCYTAAEDAKTKRWLRESEEYEDNLAEELRQERKRRTAINGLKGYCS